MGKFSILVYNKGKIIRKNLHATPKYFYQSRSGGTDQIMQHVHAFSRNQTGFTDSHQLPYWSRSMSGTILPTAMRKFTHKKEAWTSSIEWWCSWSNLLTPTTRINILYPDIRKHYKKLLSIYLPWIPTCNPDLQ